MFILFFTNCQGSLIWEHYLQNHEYFKDYTYKCIDNWLTKTIDTDSFKTCDIFVYQPMSKYTISEYDNVLNLLKPECIKICFPSIYLDIWPLYPQGDKIIGSYTITNLKDLGYSLETLLILYDNGLFSFDLKNRFKKSFDYLKEREDKYCNIKVSQFILDNYKKYELADTQNHITGILLSFTANQICDFLKITRSRENIFLDTFHVNAMRWPNSIYSIKELEIEYINENYHDYYKDYIKRIYSSTT